MEKSSRSRRDFLKISAAAAAPIVISAVSTPRVYAAEDNTIKLGIVGCGGRGGGAVRQALSTGNTKLVAVGDAFGYRAENFTNALKKDEKFAPKVADNVQIFGEMDNFKKVIDALSPGDVVLLTTPPAFRPIHFEYAVNRGLHIFAEKPVATDTPGCKRLLAANEIAKQKNLKVAIGLNNRHYLRTEETVKAVQDGAIGDIIACYVYRLHGPFGFIHDDKLTPLQNQLLGFQNWTWGNGSYMVDWMIHNIDICCWAHKDKLPIWVQGQGGRQVRKYDDQMYDHCAYEYRFDDGVKMIVQLRQIANTWSKFQSVIHGTKGCAVVGEGVRDPFIYKGLKEIKENITWQPTTPVCDSYQEEHNRLFQAIREDKPYNELARGVDATFTAIMGRMAVDSGQELTRDTAWASTYELAPGLEKLTFESDAPVMPKDGSFAWSIAVPGTTKQY